MNRPDRLSEVITVYSRSVIAVVLVLTVVVGAGAGVLDQSSSLDQFSSDSAEAEELSYVEEHFSTGPTAPAASDGGQAHDGQAGSGER